jgi:subtilase family serine protease
VNKSSLAAGQVRHAALELTSGRRKVRLPITVVGSALLPDLEVTAFTVSAPVSMGAPFTLSITVQNTGPAEAGAFFVDFFVSPAAGIGTDALLVTFCDFSGLKSGATMTCEGTIDFDPERPVPPGAYHLVAVVDSEGEVGESDESDNVVSQPLTVE